MAKARGEKTLGWRILAGIVIPILLVLGRYTFRNSEREENRDDDAGEEIGRAHV